ncbi:MAG TPA: transglycosylase SLT domain-containing protein [Streptomyces sp.]|nr:transglycosylase SLT domain-containing protein [Streptomyces sp.]
MRISAYTRLTRTQKTATIGLTAAAGVAALTAGIAPGAAAGGDSGRSPAKPVAGHSVSADASSGKKAEASKGDHATGNKSVQLAGASAGHQTKAYQGQKAEAAAKAQAEQKSQAKAEAKAKAEQKSQAAEARTDQSASRSAERPSKSENVDGWIKEARAIMKEKGIPGSHEGIKKNIMRESGGDPNAVNDWDINAKNGTPSKGLLQTIQPTFDSYHVDGTKDSVTDPVANIVAACNYAADKYGSMDNVDSAY